MTLSERLFMMEPEPNPSLLHTVQSPLVVHSTSYPPTASLRVDIHLSVFNCDDPRPIYFDLTKTIKLIPVQIPLFPESFGFLFLHKSRYSLLKATTLDPVPETSMLFSYWTSSKWETLLSTV